MPLDLHGALSLAADLLAATARAQAEPKGGTPAPSRAANIRGNGNRYGLGHDAGLAGRSNAARGWARDNGRTRAGGVG